jgi:Tol biopolymer transport system component
MAALVLSTVSLVASDARQSSSAAGPRNGVIAYEHLGKTGTHFQIFTVSGSGTHRQQLTKSRTSSSYGPSYSPNGKQIVFVRAFKQIDLWTMNADGSKLRRLTSTKGTQEGDPAWSPDGQQIAFDVKGRADRRGIWVVGADRHDRRRLTNGVDTSPTWSPDGSEIAFQRDDAATQTDGIYVVPAAGGTPTRLSAPTESGGISDLRPAWSPDGSRILFASDRPGTVRLDLWEMNPDGSDPEQVTNTPSIDEDSPVWSPDGQKIAFVTEGDVSYQLYVSDADGANRRNVSRGCVPCGTISNSPSWQPLPG